MKNKMRLSLSPGRLSVNTTAKSVKTRAGRGGGRGVEGGREGSQALSDRGKGLYNTGYFRVGKEGWYFVSRLLFD